MTDFSLPQETERFREELRSWLAQNISEEVEAVGKRGPSDDRTFEIARAWNRLMADARWVAISWPEEYGGRGASVLDQLVYVEETVRAGSPLPVNVIGINNIAPAIIRYGSEDQKRTLLPRMMRADDIWCQGMSEPDAGSDLASLRTRAVPDGDGFVITGQKTWTSLGHRADYCQLFVRTDPDVAKQKGISCLIVDMNLPGIEARPLRTITGGNHFAEVFFEDVHVPFDALLGPLNGGWQVATTTLSHERANAARLYSELQVRLEELVASMAATDGGRTSRTDDPVTLHRLGALAVRSRFLEVLCKRSVSADLHGGDPFASASLAKTVWAELGQDIAALGFDVSAPGVERSRWGDARLSARSLSIAGGTTQVNKNITAQRVLGLPRR